jgi:hypothetical protein
VSKGGFFRSSCLSAILKVLALETALVALSWLLYHQLSSQQQSIRFSDVLFMIGALMLFFAAFGMLRNSYDVTVTPFALHVQASEDEKRVQVLENFMRQKSVSMHVAAIGVLAILLSVFLTYIIHI